MLGKLIKHEFKTTSRYILLIMAVLVIVTPISALYLRYSGRFIEDLNFSSDMIDTLQTFFSGVCIFIYVIAVIGVAFTTFISLMYRFYKSMIDSEGYLTHTLPVKISSILFSKGLVAFVWTIASTVLVILSLAVFTRILGVWTMDGLCSAVKSAFRSMNEVGISTGHIVFFTISYIIQMINNITMIGACFGIGHRMSGHPILGTIVSYFGISFVLQIVTSIMMSVAIPLVGTLFDSVEAIGNGMYLMLSGATIYNIVLTVIFALITVYMFKNKLNI